MINLLFFNFSFLKCKYLKLPKSYSFALGRFEIRRFRSYRIIKENIVWTLKQCIPVWPLD